MTDTQTNRRITYTPLVHGCVQQANNDAIIIIAKEMHNYMTHNYVEGRSNRLYVHTSICASFCSSVTLFGGCSGGGGGSVSWTAAGALSVPECTFS